MVAIPHRTRKSRTACRSGITKRTTQARLRLGVARPRPSKKETGVKINFERKSFTQIAQNGSQFLNSDEAPDLMESNRGNGSAGVLSTMGLLTDLGDYVKQYGWDKKVTGANAAVAKYDENGIMDGDTGTV